MDYLDRKKLDHRPDSVPEGDAEELDQDEQLLTKALIKLGMNSIDTASDGKNYAYVRLDLQGRRVKTLSGDLVNYKELRHINLSHNDITDGFDTLGALPNLITVSLQRNKLSTLADVSPCTALQLLQLDYNNINTLERFRAPSLFALTLSHNRLYSLEGVTPGDFSKLEVLDLSYNNLTSLKGIAAFPNLRHLNLSHNSLSSIDGIQVLTKLETLDLGFNKLNDIEELKLLQKLPKLTTLIVMRNLGLRISAAKLASAAANAASKAATSLAGEGADVPDESVDTDTVSLIVEVLLRVPHVRRVDQRIITMNERLAAGAVKKARDAQIAARLAVEERARAHAEALAAAKRAREEMERREAEAEAKARQEEDAEEGVDQGDENLDEDAELDAEAEANAYDAGNDQGYGYGANDAEDEDAPADDGGYGYGDE